MTVRQHLIALERDALVEVRTRRRGAGRPCRLYALTTLGDSTFVRGFEELARGILGEVGLLEPDEIDGLSPEQKVALVLERHAVRAAEPHVPALAGHGFPERARRAVAILQEISGFVEVESQAGGFAIRDLNCAYRRLLESGSRVCVWHARFLSELLGCDVCWEGSGDDGCCSLFVATPSLPPRLMDEAFPISIGSTIWLKQREASTGTSSSRLSAE